MKRAVRTHTYNFHSAHNTPQFTVRPGEIFLAETALCTGDWLQSPDDIWTPEKTCALNPTVVVAVEGAAPGDLLAVDILDIVPDRIGYTGFATPPSTLPMEIYPHGYGLNTRTVRIEDGFIRWSERIRLPVRPMIGTIGTAPTEETLSNAKGGPHGGNMDVQEVATGTTVYLPVEVPGALLHIGDAHALQGDGEICGAGGIECRATTKLRARIAKRPADLRCVRLENDTYIMTVSCGPDPGHSFREAAGAMLSWLVQDFGFTPEEGYLLMGQVMEARCTQFVNPTSSYICKMPKAVIAS